MLRGLVLLILAIVLAIPLGWGLWAGAAWIRYGHPARKAVGDRAITRFLPHCEVAERHERIVPADPATVFHAAQTFSLEQSPVIRSIFRAREILFREPRTAGGPASLPLVTMA